MNKNNIFLNFLCNYDDINYIIQEFLKSGIKKICKRNIPFYIMHPKYNIPHSFLNKIKNDIQVLDLSYVNMNKHIIHSVSNCHNLRQLIIQSQNKKSVCCLKHLTNLQYLILYNCDNITNLNENIQHLSNLKYIDISQTNLIELPKNIIHLEKLKYVSMRGLDIEYLDLNVIPNILFLNMENTRYRTIQYDKVQQLRELKMNIYDKKDIAFVFKNKELRTLSIFFEDNIQSFELFKGQSFDKLKELNINSSYPIYNIIECNDFFKSLPSLQELKLYNLSISYLPKDLFKVLSSLRELKLYNISIHYLSKHIGELHNLTNLSIINCNFIYNIPEDIEYCIHLMKIEITNCFYIRKLNIDLNKLEKLNTLICQGTRIKSINPICAKKNSNLTSLYLSNNKIDSINECFCYSFSNVKYINLSYNNIIIIPKYIELLSNLEYLNCSYCKELSYISKSIFKLKKLKKLLLSDCSSLIYTPYSNKNYHQLHKLTNFSLNNTYIHFIKYIYNWGYNIQYLDLSSTVIYNLPFDILRLKHLRELDLSYCYNLKKLPYKIHRLKKLSYLKIDGCVELKVLPNNIQKCPIVEILISNHLIDKNNLSISFRKKLKNINQYDY